MPQITNAVITPVSPLVLLKQLRDVMSSPAGAQERLDQVVALIASGFNSDVCSVYLKRAGEVLELFASVGLNKQSVHLTRLNVGQGLVGEIAATAHALNLANPETHPKFVYRPETGEELYGSFAGVPVLHGGKVIGVLVVQAKASEPYSNDQMEVLQTVAMVLAELAVSGQLLEGREAVLVQDGLQPNQLAGLRLSPGIARAPAVLHQPQLAVTQFIATDIAHEKARFLTAVESLQQSFDRYLQDSGLREEDSTFQIVETYMLFTQDKGWRHRIDEAIGSGLTAEAAVRRVQEELEVKMSQLASPYIKERMADLEHLSDRLLQVLLGEQAAKQPHELPEAFILVARTLGPAELLDYDRTRIRGLVLEEGSATSHTALIARAMDIPALGRVARATHQIREGDALILDAEGANVYIRPSDDVSQAMDKYIEQLGARQAEFESLAGLPAETKDGTRISLNVNAGLFVDARRVLQEGVDGIGLYRTELPYMASSDFPDVETQRALYAGIYDQLPGRRIVFRTFDIGGDKKVPYLHTGEEENPAMGLRATRIALARPAILRAQLRALVEAAAGRPLSVMFPFIAQANEFDAAHRLLQQVLHEAGEAGVALPQVLRVGVMIEIPSILWQLDALMPRLDFVSIGSNDLMQFLFACDRGAPHMANLYDTLSPVMLSVVHHIVQVAARHEVEVGFCGDMARRPLDALALLGVGVRNFSVPASSVGAMKALVRSVALPALEEFVPCLLHSSEATIRHQLAAYARDHAIAV
jgi:phosphotransferase system enzyme I (PtsP)